MEGKAGADAKARSERFISAFGKREMELAAIAIVDLGLLDADINRADVIAGDDIGYVADGFDMLCELRWLAPGAPGRWRSTEPFIARVREAVERDKAKADERAGKVARS